MKAISKMFTAALKMTVRNKQALIWTFILPIILMVLFGLAFGQVRTLSLKVGVDDEANNNMSASYVKSLEKISSFKVSHGSKDEELKALKNGDRTIVLIVPRGFGDNVAELAALKKAPAASVTGSPNSIVTPTTTTTKIAPSVLEVYYDKTNPTMSGTAKSVMNQITMSLNQRIGGTPQLFKIQEKEVTAKKYSTIDFYAAGILAMFLMMGGMMAVIVILVNYRERGILTRLKATPVKISSFMGTQIVVRVLVALVQMSILLSIAIFAFGAHVSGSWWLLGAVVIEGSLVFIALGFAISSFAKTQQTAQAISQIISMPMMFLSGVFFPTDTFPKFIQPIIKVLPLTYLADALRQVMMRGATINMIAKDMIILGIFGLVVFLVSVRAFKWE